MPVPERRLLVLLHGHKVGRLQQRGAYTRFYFDDDYLQDPHRSILGLAFEENPGGQKVERQRLPSWFSNLLPEERLRRWIAAQRGVPLHREVDLLLEVGRDLSGAVQVIDDEEAAGNVQWPDGSIRRTRTRGKRSPDELSVQGLRFSLAGVTMKFSMVRVGERLTLPAVDELGDWIVKLPDASFPGVPQNEFAMMSLAKRVGLDVPEILMRHRDELPEIPDPLWANGEPWAYSVRRFDRDESRVPIHIEDLAQVVGVYPEDKYDSNFETVAALMYRRSDTDSLREFIRRFVFNVAIGNSDAHLKNWSFLYPNGRSVRISPVYDLVATGPYGFVGLGMPFKGGSSPDSLNPDNLAWLARRLNSKVDLVEVAVDTVKRIVQEWPAVKEDIGNRRQLCGGVESSIERVKKSFRLMSAPPA
ncbi:type II toxin-antitoxin system HipA family toxin [Amycolatopsis magusensis]|uniref:type II toxin-antitoxin system HipA family toxin n=1 Tax=Amycolatopsis magusensis TaxID=882444 RepID=UPI003C2D95CF